MTTNNVMTPPPRRNPSGKPYAISVCQRDGFTFHIKEDGYDYLSLFDRLVRGEVATKTLLFDDAEHYVQLVQTDGRSFVFKRFGELDGKLDTRLWWFLTGPFYSNLMRLVSRAVADGCGIVPDMYLVAEKLFRRLAVDNYLLLEFVPGVCMDELGDLAPYRHAIAEAFMELHRHGLSLGNVKAGNLVLKEDGKVGFIDLSSRGTQLTGRAKDAIKAKRLWDIDLPPATRLDALAKFSVGSQLWIARLRRAIKSRLGLKKKGKELWERE